MREFDSNKSDISYLNDISFNFPDIKWQKYRIVTSGWDHVVVILAEM